MTRVLIELGHMFIQGRNVGVVFLLTTGTVQPTLLFFRDWMSENKSKESDGVVTSLHSSGGGADIRGKRTDLHQS